jgi:hypothetical protein
MFVLMELHASRFPLRTKFSSVDNLFFNYQIACPDVYRENLPSANRRIILLCVPSTTNDRFPI